MEEDSLNAKIPLRDGPGRGCSISEATGNEGASKELWYHRGAVIFWSMDCVTDIVSKIDISYGIQYLKKYFKEKDISKEDNRKKIIPLADHIIQNRLYAPIYKELITLGDIGLLKKFIDKVITSSFSRLKNKNILEIVEHFGWQHFEKNLTSHVMKKEKAIEWIKALLKEPGISNKGKLIIKSWVNTLWEPSLRYSTEKNDIEDIVQSISLLKMQSLGTKVIQFLDNQKDPLFLINTYAPAIVNSIKDLKKLDYDEKIIKKFMDKVREQIQQAYSSPPDKYKNWFREGKLQCTCGFCKKVNQFLPNQEQEKITFNKTLKRNLVHIENKIKESKVELDFMIFRSPPKFEAMCKKNQSRYDSQRKLFNRAQKLIKNLQAKNNT